MFWFNCLAIALIVARSFGFDEFVLDPMIEALTLAIVNLVLRFVTSTKLVAKLPESEGMK